ncbi:hypothetical protein Ancab_018842 [Ancistrocladus abbreviatus]
MGNAIHGVVIQIGFDSFVNLRNALLHFYCVCWNVRDAHQLFDEFPQQRDLVSWNTLMAGYLNVRQPCSVVELFRLLRRSYMRCNAATIVSVVSAFGDMGNHFGGELLHGHCIKNGMFLELDVVTALVSMYGKTGHINSGQRIFYGILKKDLIIWNCLIDGYARNGCLEESLSLLSLMKLEGLMPNSSTLAGVLSACAACEAGGVGQRIGNLVEEEKLTLDAVLGTALLDMYSKCGFLDKAVDVFHGMESKDVKTWTAMISAYGAHGHAKTAVALLHKMEEEGYGPNEVTFLAVLSACDHGGLVKEGVDCFQRMVGVYGIAPRIEHYGCIIDLLGRAGLLGQALDLITSLPVKADATVWRALLAACRVHGNVALGEQMKRMLAETYVVHPMDAILLSSTYAVAGRLLYEETMQEIEGKGVAMEAECGLLRMRREKVLKEIGKKFPTILELRRSDKDLELRRSDKDFLDSGLFHQLLSHNSATDLEFGQIVAFVLEAFFAELELEESEESRAQVSNVINALLCVT